MLTGCVLVCYLRIVSSVHHLFECSIFSLKAVAEHVGLRSNLVCAFSDVEILLSILSMFTSV
jgi:hypothetical protein